MCTERTSVGLDVHARSVAAAAIDGVTGEVFQTKLTPSYEHIRSWVSDLPGPVAVAYEAGPTGFGLYRHLSAAGLRCEVVAPSKLQKPAGDRVKTDARDAVHLARLLRLDEITTVSIPTVDQEAAHDLVRAVLVTKARRDRLDAAIEQMATGSEFTPVVRRLGGLRGIGTLTGFALAVELGDWHRFTGNTIGSFVGLVPSEHSSGQSRSQDQSPRPATSTPAGSWSRPPGTTAPATPGARPYVNAGTSPQRLLEFVATRATADSTTAGSGSPTDTSAAPSPTSRSPVNPRAGAGPWLSWRTKPTICFATHQAGGSAWSDPRFDYEQPGPGQTTLDPRHAVQLQPNHRPAVTNPRISV